MDISIIIVSYNTKELLHNCIKSIIDQTHGVKFEIIVVDNNSTDGSIDMVRYVFPNVRLIANEQNYGFGRANNIGSKLSIGKYLLFLNSDTILVNNALMEFYQFFEENKNKYNIGVLGAVLRAANGDKVHSYEIFPRMIYFIKQNIKRAIKYDDIISKIKGVDVTRMETFKEVFTWKEVDYITGADLFMEKSLFEQLEGFDEEFFMYFEESHLQYRINTLGRKRIILTSPRIIHLEGKSSSNNKRRLMFDKSMMLYFRKTCSRGKFRIFKLTYLVTTLISLMTWREYSIKDNINYLKKYSCF